ncbi:YheC/YheD family protein [Hazenella sp. IB182353]|uniref:YheC/YheD family protein n=1 Tax=Polycladospora coralii TaxID=2771432 RepID=UPI0017461DC0|nr:YheC/YheD family protein [Polycladospora coralii]MBS7530866.1 YheC/YheD family protein [Polycladospora coralii]
MRSAISKLANTALFAQHPILKYHLPETRLLTQETFIYMVRKYPFLYLKPDDSCQGKGIFQLNSLQGHGFQLISNDFQKATVHHKLTKAFDQFLHLKMKRPYIIQQGVRSYTLNQSLFDIRVHLMRIEGDWKALGLVGRIAEKEEIVTNTCTRKGYKPVQYLFTKLLGYTQKQSEIKKQQVSQIARLASFVMSSKHRTWHELGIDIGVDHDRHIWIYESNVTPDTRVLNLLNEKLFHKVNRLRAIYHGNKQYG